MKVIRRPGWEHLVVEVCGDDLCVRKTTATWFGGSNDPDDGGETACGFPTKGHPDLLGCALPMNYRGPSKGTERALAGSPLPMMPWGLDRKGRAVKGGTLVVVTCGQKSITVPVIDYGPARRAGDGIDLTQAAFRQLAGRLSIGVIPVSYRVIGGAIYL